MLLMEFRDWLNRKFVAWQAEQGRRKTVEEFATYIGASRPLVNAWLNGIRTPGPDNKQKLIDLYGEEAIRAFGDDPDLYAVQKSWEYLTPEQRRTFSEQATTQAQKNDTKRSHQKRATRTTD